MHQINHRIGIKAPAAQVYDALTSLGGLSCWWTEEVTGDGKLGGTIDFRFRTNTGEVLGGMLMKVEELQPDVKVGWECVGGPEEWIGTRIGFELSPAEGQTIVRFHHSDWPSASDHAAHCSMKWATFLLSLREYVETGKGRPAPHDMKIDDWN